MAADDFGSPLSAVLGRQAIDMAQINRMQDRLRQAESLKQQGTAAANGESNAGQAEIDKAATQFEALLVHQMLGAMWKTVPKDGLFGGSNEQDLYRDMLHEGLAEKISEGLGIGVKEVIVRDIKRLEGK